MATTSSNNSTSQMTLTFDMDLPTRWPTLREYINFRAQTRTKTMKIIAADMDLNPSTLSRKLNPGEGDTQRFNVDDLEGYIQSTGDIDGVIEYLAAKYKDNDEARKARTLSRLESLASELTQMMASVKNGDI